MKIFDKDSNKLKTKIIGKALLIVFCLLINLTPSVCQNTEEKVPSTKEEFEEQYQRNIKKLKINGVYIPSDVNDALATIKKLATPEGLNKFKSGEEEVVVRKLKGGIGRWMIVNWNFYEGSRFSHLLKEKGLLHPEDMSAYMITILHRSLNEVELNEQQIIDSLAAARKEKAREEFGELDVIESKIRKIEKSEK